MNKSTTVYGWCAPACLGLLAVGALLLAAPSARAVDQALVNRALGGGVQYLKSIQQQDGSWRHTGEPESVGATALAALTLLEARVPPDDPAIQAAAKFLRQKAVQLSYTYSLALAILFFDRLGDQADVPYIRTLGARLLGGMTADAGWSYYCQPVGQADINNLMAELQKAGAPAGGGGGVGIGLPGAQVGGGPVVGGGGPPPGAGVTSDNSNTQFGILGLWVARRHGLPVERAFAGVNVRFRRSQHGDGGWGYNGPGLGGGGMIGGSDSSAAMTCAGLLALGLVHGVTPENRRTNPAQDPNIRGGLLALSGVVGRPVNAGGGAPGGPGDSMHLYYALWSLERMAMAFSLQTIGRVDWYEWGCSIILPTQQRDGSWKGQYSEGGVDTCFAMLFLLRANLLKDLTATLRGNINDPGKAVLRSGGVGGEALQAAAGGGGGMAIGGTNKPDPAKTTKPDLKPAQPVLDPEVVRMSNELVQASAAERGKLIAELRDGKGVNYTMALAVAIPQLSGEVRNEVREALAQRLTRLTSRSLGYKLEDEDAEVRRAAALAVATKEDRAHLARLIDMLGDGNLSVSRASYAALKYLTNQDFGPRTAAATPAEVRKAVDDWKNWLATQKQ